MAVYSPVFPSCLCLNSPVCEYFSVARSLVEVMYASAKHVYFQTPETREHHKNALNIQGRVAGVLVKGRRRRQGRDPRERVFRHKWARLLCAPG